MHLCAVPSAARGDRHLIWRAASGDNHASECFRGKKKEKKKELETFTEVLRSVKGGIIVKGGVGRMGESRREIKD